jgi:hypothetical protein
MDAAHHPPCDQAVLRETSFGNTELEEGQVMVEATVGARLLAGSTSRKPTHVVRWFSLAGTVLLCAGAIAGLAGAVILEIYLMLPVVVILLVVMTYLGLYVCRASVRCELGGLLITGAVRTRCVRWSSVNSVHLDSVDISVTCSPAQRWRR